MPQKNKIIYYFKALSKKELKEFEYFINSPFHNKNKSVVEFYKSIKKNYCSNKINNEEFEKKFYLDYFKRKVYKNSTIRNLYSNLFKLILNFIITKNSLNKSDMNSYQLLYEEISSKNLLYEYSNYFNEFLNKQINLKSYGMDFLNNIILGKFKFELNNSLNRKNSSFIINQVETLNEFRKNLDNYYFLNILKNSLNLLNIRKNYLTPNLDKLIDSNNCDIISFYEKNKDEMQDLIIDVYFRIYSAKYKIYKGDLLTYEYFYNLKKNLIHKIDSNDNYNKTIIYYLLIDLIEDIYNIEFIKKNKIKLQLYKLLIKDKLIFNNSNKIIEISLFRNIFLTAVKANDISFANTFLKNYIQYIDKLNRNNLNLLCESIILHIKNRYEESVSQLSKIKLTNFIYSLDVRVLLIKNYFKLNEFSVIYDQIKYFRDFLKRTEIISGEKNVKYHRFLFYINKITLFRNGDKSIELNYYRYKLNKEMNVFSKDWLINEFNSLKLK